MPVGALNKGERGERVETAFSGEPLTPTRVPRRVYRFCDAESATESSDDEEPRTSKRASGVIDD